MNKFLVCYLLVAACILSSVLTGTEGDESTAPATTTSTAPCNGHGTPGGDGKNKTCNCDPGYTGGMCEIPPDCTVGEGACSGHGTCTNYKCVCNDGYSGTTCEGCIEESAGVVCDKEYCDTCHPHPSDLCVDTRKDRCQCLPDHQPMVNGVCLPGCTEDSCTGDNHQCNSTTNMCQCKDGYEMNDYSECEKACPGGCGKHGSCQEGKCWCRSRHYGDHCEKRMSCADNCPHGNCTGKGDDEKCTNCTKGYSGDWCEVKCNGRAALDEEGKCGKCKDGFTGNQCENPPPCTKEDGKHPCGENKMCTKGECVCKPGYTGDNCKAPPECEVDDKCGKHQKCADYKCVCTDGYTGKKCEDKPECTDDGGCGDHKKCTDYKCVCEDGYSGEKCTADDNGGFFSRNTLAYLLVALVVCIVGYVGYHNRHKVLGLVVEGPTRKDRPRSKSSRPSNKDYSRLEENVSNTLNKGSGKTYIF